MIGNLARGGAVLFEGVSRLDGKTPIAVIATSRGRNQVTGRLLSTWILRRDIAPHEAVKAGKDSAVCGDCPARGTWCYVLPWQAPLQVWKAYKRGLYGPCATLKQAAALLTGAEVRLGSYGDPAAVAVPTWERLLAGARDWTGYSRQWRRFPSLSRLVAASVFTDGEATEARQRGFRPFQVFASEAELAAATSRKLRPCPSKVTLAALKAGEPVRLVQCSDCFACQGGHGDGKGIGVVVHPPRARRAFLASRVALA